MNRAGNEIEHDTVSGDRVRIEIEPNAFEYYVVTCEHVNAEMKISKYAALDLCPICERAKGKTENPCNFRIRKL